MKERIVRVLSALLLLITITTSAAFAADDDIARPKIVEQVKVEKVIK